MSQDRKRTPSGVPSGGEFAVDRKAESEVDLGSSDTTVSGALARFPDVKLNMTPEPITTEHGTVEVKVSGPSHFQAQVYRDDSGEVAGRTYDPRIKSRSDGAEGLDDIARANGGGRAKEALVAAFEAAEAAGPDTTPRERPRTFTENVGTPAGGQFTTGPRYPAPASSDIDDTSGPALRAVMDYDDVGTSAGGRLTALRRPKPEPAPSEPVAKPETTVTGGLAAVGRRIRGDAKGVARFGRRKADEIRNQ